MAHRRSSFRGRSGSRSNARRKTWTPLQIAGDGAMGGQLAAPVGQGSTQDVFLFTPRPDVEESTIIRTHLQGSFDPKAVTGGGLDNAASFAVGAAIVTIEAASVNNGTPNPASGVGASWDGWFMHETFSWHAFVSGYVEPRQMRIDSKAMRKLQSGNVVIFAFGLSVNAAGFTGTLSYGFSGRQLILLP